MYNIFEKIQKKRNFSAFSPSYIVKGVEAMKKLYLLLILTIIIALLPSCASGGEKFELTYKSDRSLYLVGETVKITAKVTNISGRTYTYKGSSSDFIPYVRLYPILDDGTLGDPLEHLPITSTTDMQRYKVKSGESGEVVFEFPLAEDAHVGKYTVELSYAGALKVFPEAVTVLRPAEQNKRENLWYSTITVASGGVGIYPLQGLVYTNQYLNGELALCGDGNGVYWFFDDPELDHNDFPCLVLNGTVEEYVPTHIQYGGVTLYDLNYERMEYSGGFEGLASLPAGEYLVVFTEYHDTSINDPDAEEYWKTCFADLFKLIVRS